MRKILALWLNDVKNLGRDVFLLYMVLIPLLGALLLRQLIPFAGGRLFPLTPYYPLIMGCYLLIPPMIFGMVTGFLLLDERDAGVWTALKVTPLPREGYVVYRVLTPIILSCVYALVLIPILNLVTIPFVAAIPVILLTALEAPILALFLAAFVGNKVEGLALSKGFGLLLFAPVAGAMIQSNWHWLVGAAPTYWPVKAFIAAVLSYSGYWLYLLIGYIIHVSLLVYLLGRFSRRT